MKNLLSDDPQPCIFLCDVTFFKPSLSLLALRVLLLPNAGGNSVQSEVLSAEMFVRYFGASKIKTEMELVYYFQSKIADFTLCIDGRWMGVSVTRAMGWPNEDRFTLDSAIILLTRKIYGLIVARNGISVDDSFYTSIIHVWCQSRRIQTLVREAYEQIDNYGCLVIASMSDDRIIYT